MFARMPLVCLVALGLTALSFGRGPADPIIGDYTGTLNYSETLTIAGQKKPATDHQQQWDMWFDANAMDVQGFGGTWKRNGSKYQANASATFQDVIRIQLADPKAKGSLKLKGITIHGDQSLTGKVKEKFKALESGVVVKTKRKGTFLDTIIH